MLGVVVILAVLFVAGPIALFVVGAAWSALNGWILSAQTAEQSGTPTEDAV